MTDATEETGNWIERLFGRLFAIVQALEYSSFDYMADRMQMLEEEVIRLRAEVQGRPVGKPAAE